MACRAARSCCGHSTLTWVEHVQLREGGHPSTPFLSVRGHGVVFAGQGRRDLLHPGPHIGAGRVGAVAVGVVGVRLGRRVTEGPRHLRQGGVPQPVSTDLLRVHPPQMLPNPRWRRAWRGAAMTIPRRSRGSSGSLPPADAVSRSWRTDGGRPLGVGAPQHPHDVAEGQSCQLRVGPAAPGQFG
jgi:hypothetical protein